MHHRATARGLILAALLIAGLDAHAARAEGLPVKDGLWETTMQNPMTGERVTRECLKNAVLDPQTMLEGQDDCRMTEQALDGNTLTFIMICGDGSGTAQGRMSIEGDRGDGEIDMQFDMDGQQMSMSMSWDAVRIGDC
jgi:Protein of unknown function (DUF3617)